MDYVEIKLDLSEMMDAITAGAFRNIECIRNNATVIYGQDESMTWDHNIEGAMGEKAVAKYLDRYWQGKGQMRGDDVSIYQVRASTHDNAHLVLHDRDANDKWFFLVTGRCGDYRVHGGIMARDGKRQEFYHDKFQKGRPAYWVPQSSLSHEYPNARGYCGECGAFITT